MAKTLDRTKDIFLDTMLLGNEILIKKIKTTSKTKITVVLAAFRNLDRLSKILKDLFKQTFMDFEIIIVDDSSTFEIEEFVAINDNRKINYIKKQLGSNSSAKNCALEFAKGDYIVFVEENVRLRSNYLESLYSFAEEKNLDISILTREGYTCFLQEKVVTGIEYLEEEITRFKSDLDYNLTSCLFKKKFLDVYNLRFQEDMLSLENLYFKLKAFDQATKVCQKIEEFKVGKKYETSLNLLCGYLLFDVLRISNNIEDETELIELIKSKKDYFASDTFMNRAMIAMSPILFANNLNRKDRQ